MSDNSPIAGTLNDFFIDIINEKEILRLAIN